MMETDRAYLTKAALLGMSDQERMAYLRQRWALDEDVIYGKLISDDRGDHTLWWLAEGKSPAGQPLEYPISDMGDRFEKLQSRVYIGRKPPGCEEHDFVRGAFVLSPDEVQEQRNNPLAIRLTAESIEVVRQIQPSQVQFYEDGTLNVDATLARQFMEVEHPEILREVESLREERGVLVEGAANLVRRKKEAEEAVANAEAAATAAEQQREQILGKVDEEAEERRRKEKADFDQRKAAMERAMDDERATHQRVIDEMSRHAKRLQDYVGAHADRLYRLDLITEQQKDVVTGKKVKLPEDFGARYRPDTSSEGWRGVVPRVQRHLFDNGRIVYPRALLETFLALLRTGDLIVLSGLSGSGKTQLVRAFADATGGCAHVVPVKPNWTSSEDLLGYYNPMQRAYLPTRFLDALIAAERDPDRMHYVCLDEMNLARVEYYFADFLSAMEARGGEGPVVDLYSGEEAGHVEAEFRAFVDIVLEAGTEFEGYDFGALLREEEIATQLRERLGIGDGESLVELHGRLRRMVSGVLNVPSRLLVPSNVRVIGAVNIDETTHYLSPKVLDRAHVLRFDSPLDVWGLVKDEVAATREADIPGEAVFLPANLMVRADYPPYDPSVEDSVVKQLTQWRADYFVPLGLDFGLRTTRQAIHFRNELENVMAENEDVLHNAALTHLLRQKVLPRFSFDGSRPPRPRTSGEDRKEETCLEVVRAFRNEVASLDDVGPYSAGREMEGLLVRAESKQADGIFNYWA